MDGGSIPPSSTELEMAVTRSFANVTRASDSTFAGTSVMLTRGFAEEMRGGARPLAAQNDQVSACEDPTRACQGRTTRTQADEGLAFSCPARVSRRVMSTRVQPTKPTSFYGGTAKGRPPASSHVNPVRFVWVLAAELKHRFGEFDPPSTHGSTVRRR